jgi:hypothetical protein
MIVNRLAMDKLTIDFNNALARRYALRRIDSNKRAWEATIPREIVEREARRLGITIEELEETYELECLFDDFHGIHYRFIEKNKKEDENGKR